MISLYHRPSSCYELKIALIIVLTTEHLYSVIGKKILVVYRHAFRVVILQNSDYQFIAINWRVLIASRIVIHSGNLITETDDITTGNLKHIR
jgi:hypothetical protein